MVIKLYISGISGNKEVKKKQQRVQMILDSKQISYEAIDITEPGKEKDKEFMQQNGKVRESLGKHPLPPQIFNDDDFCGDYEDFDMANEVDELEKFLHIETSSKDSETDSKQVEDSRSFNESTGSNCSNLTYNPYEYHTVRIKFNGVNGMKEEIITNDLPKEIELTEEMMKTEVNGESEAVPALDPSRESVTENVETPGEVEKEEGSTTQEEKAGDEKETEENAESQENVEESQEHDEGKAEEEDEENPENEEVENAKEEEKSPSPEEEKEEGQVEGDNEGEQSEKGNESDESEKSQEE